MTEPLGRADSIRVESDEEGFELHISTDTGSYVVNIHSVSEELVYAVNKEIAAWFAEGRALAREHLLGRPVTDDDGYAPDDPKRSDWHSVHADRYDLRDKTC
jgi:hypothetical protein